MDHPAERSDLIESAFSLAMRESLDGARQYAEKSKAQRTREEYERDWDAFNSYCIARDVAPLPASPQLLAAWIYDHGNARDVDPEAIDRLGRRRPIPEKRKPSTIQRRLAAIAYYHRAAGFDPSPTSHVLVRDTLEGFAREYAAQTAGGPKKAEPALWEGIGQAVSSIDTRQLIGLRDRALVLFGFASALRGGNLASLGREDLQFHARGLMVYPKVTKTAQRSVDVGIPVPRHPDANRDPVRALIEWMDAARIPNGPIFRSFDLDAKITENTISRRDVSRILAKVTKRGGVEGTFSSHSLRRGFLTSAHNAGAPRDRLKAVSKHKSEDALSGYIDDAEIMKDPALLYME